MSSRKVIISCAVTGSIHTPSMSPHLPVTAAEIAESALGAAEAGAAIVHLHARNPQDGRPLALKAQQVGRDPVLLASGASLSANHWALHGADQIEEWYDDAGVWAGLKGLLPDKSVMEYRRV